MKMEQVHAVTETKNRKIQRTTESRELHDLSPSRIRTAQKCGLAFKYQYIDKLPAASESAAMIFGNVIHYASEQFYGGPGPITPDNEHAHKDMDLVDLVRAQWPQLLPEGIWAFVEELIGLDQERIAVANLIKLQRDLKNPMQSKQFLESSEHAAFIAKRKEMVEVCDAFKEITWPKDQDAFAAYQKSEEVARRLEREWKPKPRPLVVEEPFRMEFEGFVVRGQIDQIRRDPDPKTGELKPPSINDIKTGRQLFTQMEAFMQGFLYWAANHQLSQEVDYVVDTDLVDFIMARHMNQNGTTKIQRGKIDPKRHTKLAKTIMNSTANSIISGDTAPHYGMWCKSCDFHEICETEIDLWDGDGVIVEMA